MKPNPKWLDFLLIVFVLVPTALILSLFDLFSPTEAELSESEYGRGL